MNDAAVLGMLLLADGRFPTGGHAHSGGVEAAVADGRVIDDVTLEAFVAGRVATAGVVDAALAAATVVRLRDTTTDAGIRQLLIALDAEAAARIPAPPWRDASRRLGRQLVRVSTRCWPSVPLAALTDALPNGAHLPVALGTVADAAGLDAAAAGRLVLHHTITTPAQAAVRLLGLDPFDVAALMARLAVPAEAALEEALAAAEGPLSDLPARTGLLVDIAAMEHREWDVRLFAT
jgi:urease accessory protein